MYIYIPRSRCKFITHNNIKKPFKFAGVKQTIQNWRFPSDAPLMFGTCDLILSLTRSSTKIPFPTNWTNVTLIGPGLHVDAPKHYLIIRTAFKRNRLFTGLIGLKVIIS